MLLAFVARVSEKMGYDKFAHRAPNKRVGEEREIAFRK